MAGCSRLPVNPCHLTGSDLKDVELEVSGNFHEDVWFDCMGKGPIAHARLTTISLWKSPGATLKKIASQCRTDVTVTKIEFSAEKWVWLMWLV